MSETVRERKAVMLLRPRLPRFATASSRTREDGPAATRHSRGDPSRKEIKEKEKREYIGSTELGYRNARDRMTGNAVRVRRATPSKNSRKKRICNSP